MAEVVLTPASPLGGYDRSFDETRLAEAPELAILAAAIPQGGEIAAEEAFRDNGLGRIPAPGRYATGANGALCLRSAADQLLLVLRGPVPDLDLRLEPALWLTDLSDAHCVLDLDGPRARPALARLCPLDLHDGTFGPDHATRTIMEHIPATLLRTGADAFRLVSARSTARDFLHALEEALESLA